MGHPSGVTQNAQGTSQQTRTYAFDGLSRVTSETNPETGSKTYTYDTDSTCGTFNGDLVKRVDAAGYTTCYSYDLLHRLTSETYSGPNATPNKYFVYDAATVNNVVMGNVKGRMAEAYTGSPSAKATDIGFVYTVRGENAEIWESTQNSGGYYHPTAAFWPNYALQNLWMSGLPSVAYGVEGEGRTSLVSASSGQNPVTGVNYNESSTTEPIGSLTQVSFGSGDSDNFYYDPKTGRMTEYQFNVNGNSEIGKLGWNANSTLATLGVTDPFNSPDAQNCSYAYDDLARLQSVGCGSVWGQTFVSDAFGNTTKLGSSAWQPTYNTKNQYASLPSFTPTYDANGDLLTDSFHTYKWDADGHVTAIDSIGLAYDALGRMVEQNPSSGTYYQIVYSPIGSKLAVMKGQTIQQAFIPLPGGTTAEYLSWGLSYYRHPDWLGSERLESSTSHSILQDTAYAPFGEPYSELSGGNGDLSFTGQNKDTDWLNFDFMYREYDPRQGRWLSPDPSGLAAVDPTDPQSWNRYAYVENNPLSSIDPQGLLYRPCLTSGCDWGLGGGSPCDMCGGGTAGVTIDGVLQSNSGSPLGANGIVACPNNDCGVFQQTFTGAYEGNFSLAASPNGLVWINNNNGDELTADDLNDTGLPLLAQLNLPGSTASGCQTVNGNYVCPTNVDKYNLMEKGKSNLRDLNMFCSTHVTIDLKTGQVGSHIDLFNPEPLPSPFLSPATPLGMHLVFDALPDFIYRQTGLYLLPAGRTACQ